MRIMVKFPSKDTKDEEASTHIYRVLFSNGGQIYEVYARGLYQSDLYGFIEIEDYVFGGRSSVVIDPQEDKLRNEFEGVKRTYLPIPCVLRVDEVEKEGVAKVKDDKGGGSVAQFPMPVPVNEHSS